MTRKKAKELKKEKKRFPLPLREDRVKRKDDRATHGRPVEKNKHKHSSRRKNPDSPRSSKEERPKKETNKKPHVKSKLEEFRSKVQWGSGHRALHDSLKRSFLGHSASSTANSSSSHTPSRPAHDITSKKLEERRSPKVTFGPEEEKRKKLAKRRLSPEEEDCPAAKRRDTEERVDGGLAKRKIKQLIVIPSSVKNTKATQHFGPETQDNDTQTSGEQLPSYPPLSVAFKIPKKSRVVKTRTGADVWDRNKKRPIPASVSSSAAEQNEPRPAEVPARVPLCSESHKTLPQVQLLQSSPVRGRSSPSKTPTKHAVFQGAFAEHTETFDSDQEMQLVEELHLARSDKRLQVNMVESYGELTCMDVDPPAHGQEQHQQNLLIVLDTNVLLSHLDIVKEMRSFGLGALGFPTLLIPWVVLQELDSLKSGKLSEEVAFKARPAVHYIYGCLKNQEPRLWGQSMQQASQAFRGLRVVNNDDQVLQCCLQYQMLYPERTLMLCTNDKNLCCKSLLSGVNALSKADLVKHADGNPGRLNCSYTQHAACPPTGHTSKEHRRQLCAKEDEASRSEAACTEQELSECVSVLGSNLQRVLSAVLEEEMKAAYGELWLEIVCLKPPWTLGAVLKCFRKHWIAVFGNIIQRRLLRCVETLSSSLCKGASVKHNSVLTALYMAEELLMALSSRSEYGGHMAAALSCLQTLQRRLPVQSCPVEGTSDGDTLMAQPVEEVAPPPKTSPCDVWAFFENLWNNICQIRSTLFLMLQYAPDSMQTMQLFSTPPPQDALTGLHRLSAAVTQLIEAFKRILSANSTVEDAQALLTFIHTSKIAAVEPQFTAKDLFECLSQQEYSDTRRQLGLLLHWQSFKILYFTGSQIIPAQNTSPCFYCWFTQTCAPDLGHLLGEEKIQCCEKAKAACRRIPADGARRKSGSLHSCRVWKQNLNLPIRHIQAALKAHPHYSRPAQY